MLFVAPAGYPYGGLATWLDYVLPGLAERGWKPVLGLTTGRFHDVEAYCRAHPFEPAVTISNQTGSPEGRVRSLCQAIRNTNPDLVISVNIADVHTAVSRLRSRGEAGVRVAMALHGLEPDLFGTAHAFRSTLDAVIGTNRLTCRLTNTVAELDPERVYYAPYGVDLCLGQGRAVSDASLNGGPLRMAYVGRIDESQKRVSDIPRILEHLDHRGIGYELLIAGGGPAESHLRETLAASATTGPVRFLGVLSREALVDQVYRRADVLLLTSFWETGPIVIWEAMASGLAVATSAYLGSGLEGSLQHGKNCLIFPIGDAARAADCLLEMTQVKRRQGLVEGGYALVKERYSLKHSVDAWDTCLRSICGSPSRAAAAPRRIATGRLDRLLGLRLGESVRRLSGRRFAHQDAGSEWPHVAADRALDVETFWTEAMRLDVGS